MPSYGGYVYFLTHESQVHLYVGVTSHLSRRLHAHLHFPKPRSFASRKALSKLVFYELHDRIESAIAREKQIKRWRRAKKDALVVLVNPGWLDLIGDRGGEDMLPEILELPVDIDTLDWP